MENNQLRLANVIIKDSWEALFYVSHVIPPHILKVVVPSLGITKISN